MPTRSLACELELADTPGTQGSSPTQLLGGQAKPRPVLEPGLRITESNRIESKTSTNRHRVESSSSRRGRIVVELSKRSNRRIESNRMSGRRSLRHEALRLVHLFPVSSAFSLSSLQLPWCVCPTAGAIRGIRRQNQHYDSNPRPDSGKGLHFVPTSKRGSGRVCDATSGLADGIPEAQEERGSSSCLQSEEAVLCQGASLPFLESEAPMTIQ